MKTVGVLGLGKTGLDTAIAALNLGYSVFLSEKKPAPEIPGPVLERLKTEGARIELGGNHADFFNTCDLIVQSPGVSGSSDIVVELKKRGIRIISDLDFAYEHTSGREWYAITGTNGKTTTTALTGEIFSGAHKSFTGGNIGVSPVNSVNGDFAKMILEVSSYQLDVSVSIRFRSSAVLNITEDHLNRYGNMENYTASKFRILGMTDGNVIVNIDDPVINAVREKKKALYQTVSLSRATDNGAFIEGKTGKIIIRHGGNEYSAETRIVTLPGEHNLYNVMTATLLGLNGEVPFSAILSAIASFKGLPHRIEFVKKVEGAFVYNDSKSTTPDSTRAAIRSFPAGKIILLLGGSDEKRSDFSILAGDIAECCVKTYAFGEAGKRIASEMKGILHVWTIEQAYSEALAGAIEGDIILFSPGCPSFDRFRNFEERGEFFRRMVNEG